MEGMGTSCASIVQRKRKEQDRIIIVFVILFHFPETNFSSLYIKVITQHSIN